LSGWGLIAGRRGGGPRRQAESILSKHVFPRWGSTPLLKVAHQDVAVWVSGLLSSGLSPATVRYVHRVFSLLLDLAVKSSRIPRNPATGVRLPRVQIAEKRFVGHQEVNALAQASGGYRVAVLLLSYCGLRWGEMAALKVSRVDLPRHRLNVAEAVSEVRGKLIWGTPKSHQTRSVPIPGFLVLVQDAEGAAAVLAVALGGHSESDFERLSRQARTAKESSHPVASGRNRGPVRVCDRARPKPTSDRHQSRRCGPTRQRCWQARVSKPRSWTSRTPGQKPLTWGYSSRLSESNR
jgi:hypothetical protein